MPHNVDVCASAIEKIGTTLDHLNQIIDEWVSTDVVPAASMAVWHNGDIIHTHAAGMRDASSPADTDTLFALASVSKPITAATVMRVIDQGVFGLDDEIGTILPEFGSLRDPNQDGAYPQLEALRDTITFRQALAHISGLPENAAPGKIRTLSLPSWREQTEVMMQTPLRSAPEERLRYSNLGPAIAALAAETATGTPFHKLTQRLVLDELELTNILLTPDAEDDGRIAKVQDAAHEGTPAESYNSQWWRENGIPWGGYFGSPTDVLTFASSFIDDTSSILSHESRAAMTTDQASGVDGGVESLGAIWTPAFWGVGWEVKGTKRRHWTGTLTSPNTYCHWGQAGTLCWVDPISRIGLAIFASRAVKTPWPLRPPRWSDLSDAVVTALTAG